MIRYKMKGTESKLHRIETRDVFIIALCCVDDKRHISDDRINSLAYFHIDVKI